MERTNLQPGCEVPRACSTRPKPATATCAADTRPIKQTNPPGKWARGSRQRGTKDTVHLVSTNAVLLVPYPTKAARPATCTADPYPMKNQNPQPLLGPRLNEMLVVRTCFDMRAVLRSARCMPGQAACYGARAVKQSASLDQKGSFTAVTPLLSAKTYPQTVKGSSGFALKQIKTSPRRRRGLV